MDFISKTFSCKPGSRCIVIAEIGVNHNNNSSILFKLIDEGVKAGADIIKLQRFLSEDEIAITAPTTEYQKEAGENGSQLEMAQKLELSDNLLIQAFEYCKKLDVGFLCTAFEHGSVDFIADVLGCKTIKVPSPEINNKPLIEHMAKKFESLIVSTGASDLAECTRVIDWIQSIGDRKIILMHCTSQYPAPIEQVNLKAIETMHKCFGLPIGYSDHTVGTLAGTVAATLGAVMIEKHYTLDKRMKGPDHKASADLTELKMLVNSVADVHHCLGNGIKKPVKAESNNLPLIRKSLTCAANNIAAGTIITRDLLGVKRPRIDGAIEAFDLEKIVGMRLNNDKTFDEPILWSDFKR